MIVRDERESSKSSFNGIVVPYIDREDAVISIVRLDEPYGRGTSSVISIGSSLKSKPESPTWKIHIPINLIDEVAKAMLKISKEY